MSKVEDALSHQKSISMFTDAMIRLGLIAFVVVSCLQVFQPFIGLMLWALILAVALYPMQLSLANKLGGRQGRAATIIVIVGVLIIGIPMTMIGNSFGGHIHTVYTKFEAGQLEIRAPKESVKDWPIVGDDVYKTWNAASKNLPAFVEKSKPQLKNLSKKAIEITASTAGAVFAFIGSLIVAGIMLAYGAAGGESILKIFSRFTNPTKGAQLQSLSIGTVRSVATGVIGVAFIQALLLGVGFIFADVPAAGVLAFLVMVLGILQLPAALISLPVIGYLWIGGDASTTSNIVFSVYLLIAGLADNVLKPLLLGRGVDAPMPVILLGALGGMVSAGIIGLFIGAVLLAVGYQIFMDWVEAPAEHYASENTGE